MKMEWNDIREGDPPWPAMLMVTRNGIVDIAESSLGLYFDKHTGQQIHDVTHWALLPEPAVSQKVERQ